MVKKMETKKEMENKVLIRAWLEFIKGLKLGTFFKMPCCFFLYWLLQRSSFLWSADEWTKGYKYHVTLHLSISEVVWFIYTDSNCFFDTLYTVILALDLSITAENCCILGEGVLAASQTLDMLHTFGVQWWLFGCVCVHFPMQVQHLLVLFPLCTLLRLLTCMGCHCLSNVAGNVIVRSNVCVVVTGIQSIY